MKTETKPAEANPERAEFAEYVGKFRALGGGPLARLRGGRITASYVLFGKTGTLTERVERYTAVAAAVRASQRLQRRYGVRLTATGGALERAVEIANLDPEHYRPVPAVVAKHVGEPAERLARSGRAKRGDVLVAEKHALGNLIRVGVSRKRPRE